MYFTEVDLENAWTNNDKESEVYCFIGVVIFTPAISSAIITTVQIS